MGHDVIAEFTDPKTYGRRVPIDSIDWNQVQRAYAALGWVWIDPSLPKPAGKAYATSVPSAARIEHSVRYSMEHARAGKPDAPSCSGGYAAYGDGTVAFKRELDEAIWPDEALLALLRAALRQDEAYEASSALYRLASKRGFAVFFGSALAVTDAGRAFIENAESDGR